jgi:hypothetical protein
MVCGCDDFSSVQRLTVALVKTGNVGAIAKQIAAGYKSKPVKPEEFIRQWLQP